VPRLRHFLPGLTRAATAPIGECAAAGDKDPPVILGFQTGHGAPNGNPRTEGDRRSRNFGVAALGWLLTGLALAFLGYELWRSNPWSLAGAHAPELALVVALGSVAYGLAGFLPAEAWRQLLGPGPAEAYPRQHRALYGRTQIAKYLPGNVFHLVSRQVLGRSLGHPHGTLALASLAETLSLLLVAGVLAAPLVWSRAGQALEASGWLVVAMAAIVIAPIWLERRRSPAGRPPVAASLRGKIGTWAARALRAGLLHAAFFIAAGLILFGLAAAIQAQGAPALAPTTAIAALAVAWLAGFVVPGSSAGVGVREAVLVLTLEPQLTSDGAMLLALALRLITTFGDLLFFAVCSVSCWNSPPPPARVA
jgi:hypothetical protein